MIFKNYLGFVSPHEFDVLLFFFFAAIFGFHFAWIWSLRVEPNIAKNYVWFQYLMKSCKFLKGGLQEVADQLELLRIGPQHQAGSDSLLTGMAFFKMKEVRSFFSFESSSPPPTPSRPALPVLFHRIISQFVSNRFDFNFEQMYFEDNIDDSKYSGHLYGLGNSFFVNGSGMNIPPGGFHDNGETSTS